MNFLLTLISANRYIDPPQDWIGWFGWLLLLGVNAALLWKWIHFNKPLGKQEIILLTFLALAVPPTSLFIGIQLPITPALTPYAQPREVTQPIAMIFAALPWALAAGLLGPASGAGIAFLVGLFQAYWYTHSLFTPLETALLAIVFSALVCQRYRTKPFQLGRHPMIASILLILIYPFLHMLVLVAASSGPFVSRLDYAVVQLVGASLAMAIELVVAGLICEIIAMTLPSIWGNQEEISPSPAEKSLRARLLYSMLPLSLILVLLLMIGSWHIASQDASNMVYTALENTAHIAAKNVPNYLGAGQVLFTQLATEPDLVTTEPAQLNSLLEEKIHQVSYFDQLAVYDHNKKLLAAYPNSAYVGSQQPEDEKIAFDLALEGLPFQFFAIPPAPDTDTAQVSFIAPLYDENNQAERVLVGRSIIGNNLYAQAIISTFDQLKEMQGTGMLLDEDGRILVHPESEQIMTTFPLSKSNKIQLFEDIASNGTRRMVYVQPAEGFPWTVVLTVPAYYVQQRALRIAAPILLMILVLFALGAVVLRWRLDVLTGSLKNLASQAELIAQGDLDHPLQTQGEDEVGQLSRASEQMRTSLKARLDELNRLVGVSQGIASSLEMPRAVQPVLDSALLTGASLSRVVLNPSFIRDLNTDTTTPISYSAGQAQNLYHELDEQILSFTRQQERLVLANMNRPRLFILHPEAPQPGSIAAVSLRRDSQYYGALWIAFDQPHTFSEEEVRFLVTLGSQASMAAANASLFLNAEIGRQRLEAVLASSPDPVLVTDQRNRLLLANPAAWQVLHLGLQVDEGQPIEQVIKQPELLELIRSNSIDSLSREMTLPDGKVYNAIATPVIAEGQRVGRVCILHDITHFKELDEMKSDFVSTVSHDLRSPLTLMRGYATMLEMVGQLNEQQILYVKKIITGVENMTRLVNNLLDLSRIEAGVGLKLERVSPQEVAERVTSGLQLMAAQKRITLTTEIPPQTPIIEADQALLQQAVHNLIENAINFTRNEGRVVLAIEPGKDSVIFTIIDNGIGISPVDQQYLFEKFSRASLRASEDRRGAGLGLAIVKSIAERHHGRVWAESKLGQGSKFFLEIPIRQKHVMERS